MWDTFKGWILDKVYSKKFINIHICIKKFSEGIEFILE